MNNRLIQFALYSAALTIIGALVLARVVADVGGFAWPWQEETPRG